MDSPDLIAAEVLWTSFAATVCGLLRHALGSEASVDDDALEVILQVLDGLPGLADDAPVIPVVLSATARIARKRLRRDRWLKARSSARTIASDDAAVKLDGLMGRLGPRVRVAFAFHFIGGLGIEDVAAALGWSPLLTQRRLTRAWAKLAALLERGQPALSDRNRPALAS